MNLNDEELKKNLLSLSEEKPNDEWVNKTRKLLNETVFNNNSNINFLTMFKQKRVLLFSIISVFAVIAVVGVAGGGYFLLRNALTNNLNLSADEKSKIFASILSNNSPSALTHNYGTNNLNADNARTTATGASQAAAPLLAINGNGMEINPIKSFRYSHSKVGTTVGPAASSCKAVNYYDGESSSTESFYYSSEDNTD